MWQLVIGAPGYFMLASLENIKFVKIKKNKYTIKMFVFGIIAFGLSLSCKYNLITIFELKNIEANLLYISVSVWKVAGHSKCWLKYPYSYSLTKYKLPNPRETENIIFMPFVMMLRGPKSTQMLYNPYICVSILFETRQ